MEREIDKRLTVDIPLDFPIELDGGGELATVTIRRPKVRDTLKAERAKGNDFEKGLALLCDLTEQPREVLEGMDPVDLEKLDKQLSDFRGLTATPESYGYPS